MGRRDILKRIDRSLDRIDAHLARGNDEFRLNREFQAKALEDWREFTRQMILRVERLGRDVLRELRRLNDGLERQGAELARQGVEMARQGVELARQGVDQSDQNRAVLQSLMRMLDRLDRLEPPPAGA